MRIILIHIIVALLLGFWSNGAAAQEGEFRSLEPFERVLMKGNWDVILEQGTEASIRMAAKDMRKLDKVEVTVENNQLKLTYHSDRNKEWKDHPRIKVYLVYTELSDIEVEGKLVVEHRSTIKTDHFKLNVEGYLKGGFEVVAQSCDVDGLWENFDLDIEGMGKVKASEFITENTNVKMEGMVSAYVHAKQELTARVEGMAKLGYMGDPPSKNINREGLTLVSKR
ncbi:MAG: DUF2807 domain-containing protein [Saprospiraceae bacterium]|nr:DUF2807 domain-containing protein [Saprospiraceae bacterium]